MKAGVPPFSNPPSPSVDAGVTTRDIAANPRFRSGEALRHAGTQHPHDGSHSPTVATQARRTLRQIQTQRRTTKVRAWVACFALSLAFWALLLGSLFATGAFSRCRTHRCWHKVSVKRHVAWRWRWIKAHPMPRCTWVPESGPVSLYGEWSRKRYRVKNTSSTAAGKYQLLDQSAHATGIPNYPGTHDAAKASPLAQENAARRLMAIQGIHAWARC